MQELNELIDKLEEIEELLLENESLNNLVAEQEIFAHNLSDKIAELKNIESEKIKDKANNFIKEEIEIYFTMEEIACHNQSEISKYKINIKYNINNLTLFLEEVNRQLKDKNLEVVLDRGGKMKGNKLIVHKK